VCKCRCVAPVRGHNIPILLVQPKLLNDVMLTCGPSRLASPIEIEIHDSHPLGNPPPMVLGLLAGPGITIAERPITIVTPLWSFTSWRHLSVQT
jgi:hypothetical protein